MKTPSKDKDQIALDDLLGLGKKSTIKSYYPQLQKKIDELENERNKLNQLFNKTINGILIFDHNFKITEINPSFAKILKYNSQADFFKYNSQISQLFISKQMFKNVTEKIKNQENTKYETSFLSKDKEPIPIILNIGIIDNNYFQLFIDDISLLKKKEKELTQLKNNIKDILDSISSVIISVNKNYEIQNMNKKALKFVRNEDFINKNIFAVLPFLTEYKEYIEAAINDNKTYKSNIREFNFNDLSKFFSISFFPISNTMHNRAVIKIDDVTEKYLLEQTMIQSEKMMSIGGIAAGMAHEINNPLAGIIQSCQVILNRLDTSKTKTKNTLREYNITDENFTGFMNKKQIFKLINNIRLSGIKAGEIVKNMLNFSKKNNVAFKKENINSILIDTINLASHDYNLKKKFDFNKVEIQKNLDPNLPLINCIRNELEQVFFNILQNGVHAFKNSKIINRNPRLEICSTKKGEYGVIQIKDNGPGIAPALIDKVFDPFFTTKDAKTGTGLGLSVSKFIIEEHHLGRLLVQNNEDYGVTFIIFLPI